MIIYDYYYIYIHASIGKIHQIDKLVCQCGRGLGRSQSLTQAGSPYPCFPYNCSQSSMVGWAL